MFFFKLVALLNFMDLDEIINSIRQFNQNFETLM